MTTITATERAALVDRLRTGHAEVMAAVAGVTEAELDRRPSATSWTAREIVHHLADAEVMAYARLCRLVAEDEPLIPAYDENVYVQRLHYGRPIAPALATFEALRAANLALLEQLSEEEWSRTGTHSEAGPFSIDRWLDLLADHAPAHADQIRRARRGED